MASSKNRPQLSASSVLLFVLATAAALTFAAEAQSQDCSTLVLSMADCLTYVTSGSTVSKPEGQCCSGLKSVLRTDAQCLCDAFKNSASFGVQLDLKRALGLPAACHVAAPSAKTCGLPLSPSGSLSPAAAPAASPVSGGGGSPSSSSPSIANAPSGGGEGGSDISPSAAAPQQGANGSQMLSSLSPGCSIALVFAAASFIFSN